MMPDSRVDHSVSVPATLNVWPPSLMTGVVRLVPNEGQRDSLRQRLCDLASELFAVSSGVFDGRIGDQFDVVLTIKSRDA
jgi:hypothetical protein